MQLSTKLKRSATHATGPPNLGRQHSGMVNLLGLVFVAMAICQLISFNEFEIILALGGLSSDMPWAIMLILAELLAAVGFFRLHISHMLRVSSAISALDVSGFWFILNVKLISEGMAGLLPNIGFFGDFLAQSPGWWTTVETTILFLWVVYALDLMRSSLSLSEA